jgi:hypothetical protein
MGSYNTADEFERACDREDYENQLCLAMIRKMLDKNYPIADIIALSEWPEEDILAVAKQMKQMKKS